MGTFERPADSAGPAAYGALQILAGRQEGERRRRKTAVQAVRPVPEAAGFRRLSPLMLPNLQSGRVYRE